MFRDLNLDPRLGEFCYERRTTTFHPSSTLFGHAFVIALAVAIAASASGAVLVASNDSGLQPWQWLLLVASLPAAYYLFVFLSVPAASSKPPAPTYIKHDLSKCPPPFPNGWFKVANSRDIKAGQAYPLRVLGRDLVIYRTAPSTTPSSCSSSSTSSASGAPSVPPCSVVIMDAFCPHLGANLAVGGRVDGDCIRCPFHGWAFRASDGTCVDIPYSQQSVDNLASNANAKAKVWQVMEWHGAVLLWHHALNAPPAWQLPDLYPGFQHTRYDGTAEIYINCHVQTVPENGSDFAHFQPVHSDFIVPGFFFLKHLWSSSWEPGTGDRSHMTDLCITTQFQFFGKLIPKVSYSAYIHQIGPGLVTLMFSIPLLGRVMVLESVTPVAPLTQQAQHTCFADSWVPRFVSKIILMALLTQFEADVPIWSNLQHTQRPMVVKGDGPILRFRRWYRQFYSDPASSVSQDSSAADTQQPALLSASASASQEVSASANESKAGEDLAW